MLSPLVHWEVNRGDAMHKYMNYKEMFENRDAAIEKLLNIIPQELTDNEHTLFIGMSLGGTYMAQKIAQHYNRKSDILLLEHIMAPNNENLTIAIVTESEDVVIHTQLISSFDISEDFVYSEAKRKYDTDILDNKYKFRKGEDIVAIKDQIVILVDETSETGLSMYAAVKSMITLGAKSVYLLSPIMDKAAYNNLLGICDGVFTPTRVIDYVSCEHYYKKLPTLSSRDLAIYKQSK